MSLHVLFDVRLLGKGTATRNALKGLLPCVAVGTRLVSIPVYKPGHGLSAQELTVTRTAQRCNWPSF